MKGTDKHLANRNPDRLCRLHVKDKVEKKLKLFFNNLLLIEIMQKVSIA